MYRSRLWVDLGARVDEQGSQTLTVGEQCSRRAYRASAHDDHVIHGFGFVGAHWASPAVRSGGTEISRKPAGGSGPQRMADLSPSVQTWASQSSSISICTMFEHTSRMEPA